MGFGSVLRGGLHHVRGVFLEGISVSIWEWEEPEVEQWREAEAVRLLQEVGATVAGTTPPGPGLSLKQPLVPGTPFLIPRCLGTRRLPRGASRGILVAL